MNQKQADQSDVKKSEREQHQSDYAPYPKIDPSDVAPLQEENWSTVAMDPPPPAKEQSSNRSAAEKSEPVTGGPELRTVTPPPVPADTATTMPAESNPYVSSAPAGTETTSSVKNKMDSMRDVIRKWGEKAAEATKRAEDIAGNMWQHLKTGPSFADAAVGRIAQGTKVLAEGGYEKIFRQTFETVPEEQLLKSYACYLSTSAGPVMGILYLSTAKLAFCSDNPLSYKVGDKTEWSYYKVVIPIHQLKAVNPSVSKVNQAEKYIQVISVDNHEFWFMGFVNYDSAVKNLQGAVPAHTL